MTVKDMADGGDGDLSIDVIVDDEIIEEVVDDEIVDDGEDDEIVVSIDGVAPAPEDDNEEVAKAPEWVREVRRKNRELERESKELKAKLQAVSGVENTVPALGKKPQLHDDGIDYDADKFEEALTKWHDDKRKVEQVAAERAESEKAQQKAWQDKLDDYAVKKSALKVRDFADAEDVIQNTLSSTQQGIIVAGCENPALVTYAIGKNQAKAQELSSIKDPVKFAFAVAKLESNLKVSSRKQPPQPEQSVTGNGRPSNSIDKQLDRLRAEAEKSGNYSKVLQYKNQLKAKSK